ncbi:MAG TPA: preprotein translocase subunit SecE [Ktedonobacterales bacterium]
MAKTVDTKKAAPKDVLDGETPQDAEDPTLESDAADEEEEDLSLEVDPTAQPDESASAPRALTTTGEGGVSVRTGAGGIYVPEFMMGNPITRWLAEAYIELRKVTWPQRRDAWNMTLVVITVSVIMALLLAAADFGLGHLLAYLVGLGLGK